MRYLRCFADVVTGQARYENAEGDNDFVQAEAGNPDSRAAWFEDDGKRKHVMIHR